MATAGIRRLRVPMASITAERRFSRRCRPRRRHAPGSRAPRRDISPADVIGRKGLDDDADEPSHFTNRRGVDAYHRPSRISSRHASISPLGAPLGAVAMLPAIIDAHFISAPRGAARVGKTSRDASRAWPRTMQSIGDTHTGQLGLHCRRDSAAPWHRR